MKELILDVNSVKQLKEGESIKVILELDDFQYNNFKSNYIIPELSGIISNEEILNNSIT